MYRYDAIDHPRRRTGRPVPRPDAPPPRRRAFRGRLPARCACRTACTSSATRRCCAWPSPTGCCRRRSCAGSPASRASTTAATATSRRARTSSTTGRSSPRSRRSSPSSPRSRCTPSRPAATASATSPPTTSPASRPTSTSTRARSPRSCGQWSTLHPEFAFLPRKFKIALSGAEADRAATLAARHRPARRCGTARGELGLRVIVGGGLGRTPIVGHVVREFLPWRDLLTYLEAILRVYNRHGRRDNVYKARIKILVKALGVEAFRAQVEAEVGAPARHRSPTLTDEELGARRRPFRAAAVRAARPTTTTPWPSARRRPGLRALGPAQRPPAPPAGLSRGDALAQEDRRAAGRRDRRPDGPRRGTRRALQLRRAARLRTSRT